ncbi:hypothetical protein MVEN_02126900 [Mycena venus]|uniref:DUF4185 domain-containing protein n=1 Tax=Mycena venus TaxID=2733690 RepID=A0A8H6XA66_9AGAR|nr:hypothetical protein MVEN_02126900 [Mycena venus]
MVVFMLQYAAATLLFCATARAVTPIVASTTSYGSLNDPLNRDSCSSSLWTNNVVLWVCRDSQIIDANGNPEDPSIANTASFSSLPSAPHNPKPLVLSPSETFGTLFYPLEADECPPLGLCNGTRWVGWPDTGPVVTFRDLNGAVNAYAFMTRQHLSGLDVIETPGYSLYRVVSEHAGPLPTAKVEISKFWSGTQIGYGTAASVLHNGFAYLYGATPNRQLAVARAKLKGLFGSLEDKSIYEYYVNGSWTKTTPLYNDTTIVLPNTSSKQGTMYWSPKWQSYVWIGGDSFPDANFLISTAPKPEGPWSAPQQFYSGAVGNGSLPAYSAVAHPSLTDGTGDYIFITWTRTRPAPSGEDLYDTPLVRVDWK